MIAVTLILAFLERFFLYVTGEVAPLNFQDYVEFHYKLKVKLCTSLQKSNLLLVFLS